MIRTRVGFREVFNVAHTKRGVLGTTQSGLHKMWIVGESPALFAQKGVILANPTVFDTKVGCGESMLFVYGSFSR